MNNWMHMLWSTTFLLWNLSWWFTSQFCFAHIVRSVAYQVIKCTIVFCFVGYYKSLADLAKDNLTSSPSTKADVLVLHHDDLNTDHFGDPSPRGHECITQQPSEIDLQVRGIDLLIHLVRINAASSKKSDGLRLGMRIQTPSSATRDHQLIIWCTMEF